MKECKVLLYFALCILYFSEALKGFFSSRSNAPVSKLYLMNPKFAAMFTSTKKNQYLSLYRNKQNLEWGEKITPHFSLSANKDINSLQGDGKESAKGGNASKIAKIVLASLIIGVIGLVSSGYLKGVDVNGFMEQSLAKIEGLGPLGYLYFGLIYIFAEVLAIPVFPLTASSGYLFGLFPGTLVVLLSATIAAGLSFIIGRTFLREWAQKIASGSAKWRAVDKAISKEGFKVVLLLRLSPLLPFSVSNYLYGLTSVDFWSFLSATMLGFAPGSFGIVYAGSAGKAIFDGEIPWYFFAIGAVVLGLVGQTVAKIASEAIKNIEEEEKKGNINDDK